MDIATFVGQYIVALIGEYRGAYYWIIILMIPIGQYLKLTFCSL